MNGVGFLNRQSDIRVSSSLGVQDSMLTKRIRSKSILFISILVLDNNLTHSRIRGFTEADYRTSAVFSAVTALARLVICNALVS